MDQYEQVYTTCEAAKSDHQKAISELDKAVVNITTGEDHDHEHVMRLIHSAKATVADSEKISTALYDARNMLGKTMQTLGNQNAELHIKNQQARKQKEEIKWKDVEIEQLKRDILNKDDANLGLRKDLSACKRLLEVWSDKHWRDDASPPRKRNKWDEDEQN